MPTSVVSRVAHGHLAFALAVHRALPVAATDTVCWSPFSVASALGLAAAGARGSTRAELAALLGEDHAGGPADLAALLRAAATLTQSPMAGDQPVLAVSNTLWARQDIPIHGGFADELLAWPNGALRDAPFADPEAARGMINADVAETTRGLIRELLAAGDVDHATIAVLVNALYLKVAWINRFADALTRPFHTLAGTTSVPTMRLEKSLGYQAIDGWQVVTLPAAGGVQGVVLLPDRDLASAEAALDVDALARLLAAPVPARVDLYLPKFRVKARAGLQQTLERLGVRTMFGPAANFGAITDEPMRVSSVVHEAVLRIDEQGLEGAAATAVVMRAMALRMDPSRPIVVDVDRPFLFLVRHNETGAIYFIARVVDPGKDL
jgi:serpin B